ncbi:MAG: hypothetical protein N2691_01740 [Patescibacteria group bacterium]|nr:hypothetical protein [Patescibacteria group bacterium]
MSRVQAVFSRNPDIDTVLRWSSVRDNNTLVKVILSKEDQFFNCEEARDTIRAVQAKFQARVVTVITTGGLDMAHYNPEAIAFVINQMNGLETPPADEQQSRQAGHSTHLDIAGLQTEHDKASIRRILDRLTSRSPVKKR